VLSIKLEVVSRSDETEQEVEAEEEEEEEAEEDTTDDAEAAAEGAKMGFFGLGCLFTCWSMSGPQ